MFVCFLVFTVVADVSGHRPKSRLCHAPLSLAAPFLKRGQEETPHREADATICYIEGRPRISVRHVQIEEQKIDHVPVNETICHIAQNAAHNQAHAPEMQPLPERAAVPRDYEPDEGRQRERDEKNVAVLEGAESRARVPEIDQI